MNDWKHTLERLQRRYPNLGLDFDTMTGQGVRFMVGTERYVSPRMKGAQIRAWIDGYAEALETMEHNPELLRPKMSDSEQKALAYAKEYLENDDRQICSRAEEVSNDGETPSGAWIDARIYVDVEDYTDE